MKDEKGGLNFNRGWMQMNADGTKGRCHTMHQDDVGFWGFCGLQTRGRARAEIKANQGECKLM